ncbi:hypothetical protein [Trichocoleus sp. FACHB-262]|uniref:hypothetical protein n=1 Tax=Trichocoleus sp. FACHB-262 TaxID=2692869 RepID=UPI0016891D6B|nr:hypothetical protein [Trichocoleus sp. FACHB-262]MBD2121295.1 hypothetical protein [Trichocoleus sp. FACHB-262]
MRLRFKLGLLAILLGCSLGGGLALQAFTQQIAPSISNASTLFDPVHPTLKRTQIPLRLPTYLPQDLQIEANYEPPPIQAVFPEQPSNRGYKIVLGYSPTCSGGNACRLGTVAGHLKPAQSIESEYAWVRRYPGVKFPEPMQKVKLANDIEGWFIPWTCAANCSDAKVVWDEYSYRYSMGIKVGDRAALVKMANSAIEAGDP